MRLSFFIKYVYLCCINYLDKNLQIGKKQSKRSVETSDGNCDEECQKIYNNVSVYQDTIKNRFKAQHNAESACKLHPIIYRR